MRILIFGFTIFVGWAVLSTYIYVCKIKGLCYEPQPTVQLNTIGTSDKVPTQPEAIEVKAPDDLVIYFDYNRANFNPGKDALRYYDLSSEFIKQNSLSRITITGHTDAAGTNDYNMDLGTRRAQVLKDFFESKGIQPSRLVIESKGEQEPTDNNNTISGRANNRRTVVTLNK
jgi:OOP family OmpA-OmpF porin